ncbi:MAG: FAD-dependent oxidoreductase [Candidatus Omnitrophota bacterium]
MARIVIIGNSAAGFSCCEGLTKLSTGNEITVVSGEGCLPYNKKLFFDYLGKRVKEEDIFLCPASFYSDNNITFLKSAIAVKVNTHRHTVILKDNTRISYDYLVIASGTHPAVPDIPGKSKKNIFSFFSLEDIRQIGQQAEFADTICLCAEASLSLSILGALSLNDKKVKIISRKKPDGLSVPDNVEWIEGLELTEFIGEGSEVQAFKLSNGKVISASLVVWGQDFLAESDFLKDSGVEVEGGYVLVDDNMRTNIENIFSCGSVCRRRLEAVGEKTWEEAVEEGSLACRNIAESIERKNTPCLPTS